MMVDHDDLFVDDAYEAATDNEESEVSEFSSHDGGDTDADPGIDAPLAALVEPPAVPHLMVMQQQQFLLLLLCPKLLRGLLLCMKLTTMQLRKRSSLSK
mmetsp:Transcript_33526/g.60101  ORF Transcript_33526/g.60101 Transcript_33526/m.60101 type:complete len:99 (-) Transcript_33526:219-515(-)